MYVGILKVWESCQHGGLRSCRIAFGSRLSFHPSIHQQPQRHGHLPGCKPNNNQSNCWQSCQDTLQILCLCYNNVICVFALSERFLFLYMSTFIVGLAIMLLKKRFNSLTFFEGAMSWNSGRLWNSWPSIIKNHIQWCMWRFCTRS